MLQYNMHINEAFILKELNWKSDAELAGVEGVGMRNSLTVSDKLGPLH